MTDFVVTTLEDETSNNGTLSLREAVALADAEAGADQIPLGHRSDDCGRSGG